MAYRHDAAHSAFVHASHVLDSDMELPDHEDEIKRHIPLTPEQQAFVNQGIANFNATRTAWISASSSSSTHHRDRRKKHPTSVSHSTPSDSSSSAVTTSSSSSATHPPPNTSTHPTQHQMMEISATAHDIEPSSPSSDYSSDSSSSDLDLDIPQIMDCLKNYRTFPVRIPLASMVDILTVLWEDEF